MRATGMTDRRSFFRLSINTVTMITVTPEVDKWLEAATWAMIEAIPEMGKAQREFDKQMGWTE